MGFLESIPGYKEGVEKETQLRAFSFVDVPEIVCGLPVRPMTLNDVIRLDGLKSPFIVGGMPSPEDVITFLWLQSPEKTDLKKFTKRNRKLSYSESVKEIGEFIDEAFADSPPSGGRSGESYYYFAAGYVDLLATEYGWSEYDIINMPLKRLFQYVNCIRQRKDSRACMFNPYSGKARREWLAKLNQN